MITILFPNGTLFKVPKSVVVAHRNKVLAIVSTEANPVPDNFTLERWVCDEMDWEDLKNDASLVIDRKPDEYYDEQFDKALVSATTIDIKQYFVL